jgi:hypothetical protein
MIDEENIMQKLTEMSMQYNSTNRNAVTETLSSASSSSISSVNKNDSSKKRPSASGQSVFLSSALKMIEHELNSNINDEHEFAKKNTDSTEKALNAELKKMQREHNIRDGNLVETRHLDLRSCQNKPPDSKQRIYSKHTAESLFENIMLNDDRDEKIIEFMRKNGNKIRFLNEREAASSSEDNSDSDGENESSMWIERYRKQKLATVKK